MNEDELFNRIREEASALRYEPAEEVLIRLQARVRAGIRVEPTLSQFLSGWFRPLTATFAAICLTAALGASWYEQRQEQLTLDQISTRTASLDEDFFVAGE